MSSRLTALFTGGSGRLGRELTPLLAALPNWRVAAPRRAELDVTSLDETLNYVSELEPDLIINAAAYTDVLAAERERAECWAVNVVGARNAAAAARAAGSLLVQISTDYVFSGERGHYRESDPPGPPSNYYGLTKLVAEEAALSLPGALVIRTSFRGRDWPHPQAYDDLHTSQDYVDVIAPLLAEAVHHYARTQAPSGLLHVATERKSAFELARRRAPHVGRAARATAGVPLPADVSLDTSKWAGLRRAWRAREQQHNGPLGGQAERLR